MAGTENALDLPIVGGAAAQVGAGRMQRAHVVLAGAHEVDDGSVDHLGVAVLARHPQGDRNRLIVRQRVESMARSHVSSRPEKLGANVVAPMMNATVAPIVA